MFSMLCRSESFSPLALKHSQDLGDLLQGLDGLLTQLVRTDLSNTSEVLEALSPDVLQQSITDILHNGSTFHALNIASAGDSVLGRTPSSQVSMSSESASGRSTIRMLCARLHFVGYLKYNLWRMSNSISNGSIEVCADLGKSKEVQSQTDAFNNRIPYVPMESEGIQICLVDFKYKMYYSQEHAGLKLIKTLFPTQILNLLVMLVEDAFLATRGHLLGVCPRIQLLVW